MVVGGKAAFERWLNRLTNRADWKPERLRPLTSRGEATQLGNRLFRLSPDARTCVFRMYDRRVLKLPVMTGDAGKILRQAAGAEGAEKINVMLKLDDERLHVAIHPQDLPAHPERQSPVAIVPGCAVYHPPDASMEVVRAGLAAAARSRCQPGRQRRRHDRR